MVVTLRSEIVIRRFGRWMLGKKLENQGFLPGTHKLLSPLPMRGRGCGVGVASTRITLEVFPNGYYV